MEQILVTHGTPPPTAQGEAPHCAEVTSLLNGLIETCKDGEAGYRQAAHDINDRSYEAMLLRLSDQRARFATELQSRVRMLGSNPENTGTIGATLHRGWNEVKSTIAGRDDTAILVDCDHCEDDTIRIYENAAAKDLSADVHDVVSRQMADIRAAHDEVNDARIHRIP